MSRHSLALALPTLLSIILFTTLPANAQTTPPDADFDSVPQGPWLDPLLSGVPDDMSVLDAANASTLYPNLLPPGASGNVLRVDNSTATEDAILRFSYDCGSGDGTTTCRLNYGYVAWAQVEGQGMEVHIDDDGTYLSPDFAWYAAIPQGDWQASQVGSESHDAAGCSTAHTFDVIVQAGALVLLDAVTAECLNPVPAVPESFGMIKSRF